MGKTSKSSLWISILAAFLLLTASCTGAAPSAAPSASGTIETTAPVITEAAPTETTASTEAVTPASKPTEEPTSEPSTVAVVSPEITPPSTASVITSTLTSLKMIDETRGWGLTDRYILHTQDGGSHWDNVTPEGGFASGTYLNGFFLDANTGWVFVPTPGAATGMLYRTADGGKTWTSANAPFIGGSIFFVDPQNGWVLDASDCGAGSCGGAVYQSTDGGQTWTTVSKIEPNNPQKASLPFTGDKTGISFRDQTHGWVGGTQPQNAYIWLFATQDGGQTWQQQNLTLPAGYEQSITSIDPPRFFGSQEGILPVALFSENQSRVFYGTHDSGATWTGTTPVQNGGPYSCSSPLNCWIWDGTRMDVTQDGGKSWTQVTPNINLSQTIVQLDFVNNTTGWVIAMDANGQGQLYKTTDGGATWALLLPSP